VNLLTSLILAIVITWLTRVMFIALVPADRLPPRVQTMLAAATPAVMGALTIATTLNLRAATGSGLLHQVLPLGVAAMLARRSNLAVVVLGALATGTVLRAIA
jgi:branched-subunit amino acid transport protein